MPMLLMLMRAVLSARCIEDSFLCFGQCLLYLYPPCIYLSLLHFHIFRNILSHNLLLNRYFRSHYIGQNHLPQQRNTHFEVFNHLQGKTSQIYKG